MKAWQTLAVGALLFGAGCVTRNLEQYYSPVKDAVETEFASPTGEVEVCRFNGEVIDQVHSRMNEDYAVVGVAKFEDENFDEVVDDIRKLGVLHQAALIDCKCTYNHTEQEYGVMPVPTMHDSYATVYSPDGHPSTVAVTTTGTQYVPYNYIYRRYDYAVICYRKLAKPSRFGMVIGPLSEVEASKLGSRKYLKVKHVIPNRIAWKNDIFAGDILLEFNGQPFDQQRYETFTGGTASLKLLRNEKEVVKTLNFK